MPVVGRGKAWSRRGLGRRSAFAGAAVLLACAPPAQRQTPIASSVASIAAPATVGLVPPKTPDAAVPLAEPRDESPFRQVMTTKKGGALSLHSLSDDIVIVAADVPLAICRGVAPCEPLGEDAADGLRETPRRGVVRAIGGSWPDEAWLTRANWEREGFSYDLYRRRGGRWIPVRKTNGGWYSVYLQIASCGPRCVFGLASFDRDGQNPNLATDTRPPPLPRVELLQGKPGWPLPRFDPYTSMDSLAALPTGEVAAIGQRTVTDGEGRAVLQRWGPRGQEHFETALVPEECRADGINLTTLDVRRGATIFVGGSAACGRRQRGYLARFDAAKWTNLEPPGAAEVGSISSPPGKTLWLVEDGAVWRQADDPSWQRIEIPQDPEHTRCSARLVWARTDDDVFVVADCVGAANDGSSVLFRTEHVSPPASGGGGGSRDVR